MVTVWDISISSSAVDILVDLSFGIASCQAAGYTANVHLAVLSGSQTRRGQFRLSLSEWPQVDEKRSGKIVKNVAYTVY